MLFRRETTAVAAVSGESKKFSKQEVTTLTDSLKEIRTTIKANRILLKPLFADFDTTKKQRITVQQFSRVLKQLSIMPSETAFDLVCRRYFDKGNTKEVNYVKF